MIPLGWMLGKKEERNTLVIIGENRTHPNTIVTIKAELSGKASSRSEAPNRRRKTCFQKAKQGDIKAAWGTRRDPSRSRPSHRVRAPRCRERCAKSPRGPDPLGLRDVTSQPDLCFPSYKIKGWTGERFQPDPVSSVLIDSPTHLSDPVSKAKPGQGQTHLCLVSLPDPPFFFFSLCASSRILRNQAATPPHP